MNMQNVESPDYGNWISLRIIYLPGLIGFTFLILAYLFPLLIVVSMIFLLIAVYFVYARYLFSPRGWDLQRRIRELVIDHLDWDGKGDVLDIGCGNGALVIMLAKKHHEARVTGIDYWGKNWDCSKNACETNAVIEGVDDRVSFQKASALSLPFEDQSFDAVVSNLTFHEVRDAKDKRELIREALRVLKKGGRFSFQDLFLMKIAYGDVDELPATIRSWGVSKIEFVETRDSAFIPLPLKLPFMVGTMGMLVGEK